MIPAKEEHLAIFRKKIAILEKILPYVHLKKMSLCSILGLKQTNQVKQLLDGIGSVTTYMSCNDTIDRASDEIIGLCNEIKSIRK